MVANKLGRPADPPPVVVVERDEVALLIVHRLLGVVARDLEGGIRRGVALGTGNLGLQQLLGNLAVHAVIVAPALRGEIVQVVLHVLVVLIGHVVRDTSVGVHIGPEGVGRRRRHNRHDRRGRERREVLLGHRRGRRPRTLGAEPLERRRGLANLLPRVLERRIHVGDMLEGRGTGDLDHLLHGRALGLLGLVALPGVELANRRDEHLARLAALVVGAVPDDGELALRVHSLEVDNEGGAGVAANLAELAERLPVLALAEGILGEGEGDRGRSHFLVFFCVKGSFASVCLLNCCSVCVYVSNK